MATEKLTISVEEAARQLGISRGLAYELARTGKLPGVIRLGAKRLVVSRAALERLLEGEAPQGSGERWALLTRPTAAGRTAWKRP